MISDQNASDSVTILTTAGEVTSGIRAAAKREANSCAVSNRGAGIASCCDCRDWYSKGSKQGSKPDRSSEKVKRGARSSAKCGQQNSRRRRQLMKSHWNSTFCSGNEPLM